MHLYNTRRQEISENKNSECTNVNSKWSNKSERAVENNLIQAKMQPIKTIPKISSQTLQKKENKTGMPDNIKSGIENLSGLNMDNVKVHYNSLKPAAVQAHAYAQGNDIHLASGQEKHLPHEAWHVVQQMQGRVKPTKSVAGLAVNDSSSLEKEADVMGYKASQSTNNRREIIQNKRSKMEFDRILQRIVKINETEFTPDMVYRYLQAHITGLKGYIDKADLKVAIQKKCDAKVGKEEYTVDKPSAWGLFQELAEIAQKGAPKEIEIKKQKATSSSIDSLSEYLKMQGDPILAFRNYMYDPALYYESIGVKDEIEILLDSTRRKVETFVAGELLEAAAQATEKTTQLLIAAIPETLKTTLKENEGNLKNLLKGDDRDLGIIELNQILMGKTIVIEDIVAVLKVYPWSEQTSQFLSAFELFARDIKSGKYKESQAIIENILRNLALIQIVNWVSDKYEFGKEGTYEAVGDAYESHPSYGVRRGREQLKDDKKDNTMTYPIKERGLTFDKHFKGGNTEKVDDQMSEHQVFSAAGNSLPESLPRKVDDIDLKKRFQNPGWLERARKHNQPFVNSISGICLMFRNIQEMYKKSISGSGTKPPNKKEWQQMETLLSAAIVYYPGGHTFHECMKGFKAGAQIVVDKKDIKAEEYLKWKEFCYDKDFIPDDVITKCLIKLDEVLKTPPLTKKDAF